MEVCRYELFGLPMCSERPRIFWRSPDDALLSPQLSPIPNRTHSQFLRKRNQTRKPFENSPHPPVPRSYSTTHPSQLPPPPSPLYMACASSNVDCSLPSAPCATAANSGSASTRRLRVFLRRFVSPGLEEEEGAAEAPSVSSGPPLPSAPPAVPPPLPPLAALSAGEVEEGGGALEEVGSRASPGGGRGANHGLGIGVESYSENTELCEEVAKMT